MSDSLSSLSLPWPTPMAATGSPPILYLVDISSFIFRAFFAIRPLHNARGEPTHAVFGVATMLASLAQKAHPEYLAVVYDSPQPSFRKTLYPQYKANRSVPPEDLVPQFAKVEALVDAMQIYSYRKSGVEADDLIATLTHQWCRVSPEHRVVIVTGDKDLMQLVNPQVLTWDTMADQFYSMIQVKEKFGVRPDQLRDYLGLVGDASDHIPGVPGIGAKTAAALLNEFDNLPAVLEAARIGKITGKRGETLQRESHWAVLSADLATVRTDIPVDFDPEQLRYHFQISESCVTLFKELGFHTLVTRWSKPDSVEPLWVAEDPRFCVIRTEEAFQQILEQIHFQKSFGLYLLTTDANPQSSRILGLALCTHVDRSVYIPFKDECSEKLGGLVEQVPEAPLLTPVLGVSDQGQMLTKAYVLESLKPFLESSEYRKIGQNLKVDVRFFKAHGILLRGIEADTHVAAYLLDPEGQHGLKTLVEKYLNTSLLTQEQVFSLKAPGKKIHSWDSIELPITTRYAAESAWAVFHLWKILKPLLEKESLLELFEKVEMPLVSVLAEIEFEGVSIDSSWLESLSELFAAELSVLESRVLAFANSDSPFNLNSPKQLARFLFEHLGLPPQGKTQTGWSTDAQVLEALAPLHEAPRLLLEYREIAKLKGTYVDPLPLLVSPQTGKIHARFHQAGTATGRLSSSDPNLQNIPVRTARGLQIRRAFVATAGAVLLSADYSQIELRLLAHMSGDADLLRAFYANEDIHQRTASDIFKVTLQEVTEKQRSVAKAINFGLMYGKTAFGLSQELKISKKEAQSMIDRYFERYFGVELFLRRQVQLAQETGFTSSLLGRKRSLLEIRSKNTLKRNNAERMAMNTPIQASAADLIKLAMVQIHDLFERKNYQSRLILQVHDELIWNCPEDEVDEIRKQIIPIMETAMILSVPLRVNTSVGKNWMELS